MSDSTPRTRRENAWKALKYHTHIDILARLKPSTKTQGTVDLAIYSTGLQYILPFLDLVMTWHIAETNLQMGLECLQNGLSRVIVHISAGLLTSHDPTNSRWTGVVLLRESLSITGSCVQVRSNWGGRDD